MHLAHSPGAPVASAGGGNGKVQHGAQAHLETRSCPRRAGGAGGGLKNRLTWGGCRSSGRSCPCRTPPTAPVASTGGGKDNVQHEVIELLLVMGLAKGIAGSWCGVSVQEGRS